MNLKPMNIKIGETPMTHIEAKHRMIIRDSLISCAMIRHDLDFDNSKALMYSFLKEMKDRR